MKEASNQVPQDLQEVVMYLEGYIEEIDGYILKHSEDVELSEQLRELKSAVMENVEHIKNGKMSNKHATQMKDMLGLHLKQRMSKVTGNLQKLD